MKIKYMVRSRANDAQASDILLTVPRPSDEWVMNKLTMEEKSSGDEAPAAISVAPTSQAMTE